MYRVFTSLVKLKPVLIFKNNYCIWNCFIDLSLDGLLKICWKATDFYVIFLCFGGT